jgi:GT2 family glycosyltransferase
VPESSIGVVIVSYNSEAELPGCLEALRLAGGVADAVVVDNASSDRSAAIVSDRASPRLRLVAVPRNEGFAGGCNRGFRALPADLEWIVFMNPDVRLTPDCLERCAARLRRSPDAAGAAPRLMRPDGATVDSIGQVLARRSLEVRDLGYGVALDTCAAAERDVLSACGALAFYRRSALEQIDRGSGPWSEEFFCFWEDLEIGWRLFNLGWRILALPSAMAVHGRGAGAREGRGPLRWRRPVALEACILSNRWMTLLRHLHTRDLALRFLPLMVRDLAIVALSIARRPRLLHHLVARMPLVLAAWRARGGQTRRRLAELPW